MFKNILLVCLFSFLLSTSTLAQDASNVYPPSLNQMYGFCGNTNVERSDINECFNTQVHSYYETMDLIYVNQDRPDINKIIKDCGKKAVDPHFMNMNKWYKCIKEKLEISYKVPLNSLKDNSTDME